MGKRTNQVAAGIGKADRTVILEALMVAEQAAQCEADDLRRLASRLGLHDHDRVITDRVRAANRRACRFDELRRRMEAEDQVVPTRRRGASRV